MHKKNWGRFYADMTGDYRSYLGELVVHRKFIESILDCRPGKVLEVGCGTSRMSVFLSHLGVSATALDRDKDVLALARQISGALNGSVDFVEGDAFNLPFDAATFDVAFHQGFLEHFSDEQIVALLDEQLRVARTVVFSVPSNRYPRRDFGDERLLSKSRWERILAPFRIVKSMYYARHHARPWWLCRLPLRRKVMYLARVDKGDVSLGEMSCLKSY